jgi:hypothetical protein
MPQRASLATSAYGLSASRPPQGSAILRAELAANPAIQIRLYRWVLRSIALVINGYMTICDNLGRYGIVFKKLNSLVVHRRPKRWIKDLFLPNKACWFFVIIENRLFAVCERQIAHEP